MRGLEQDLRVGALSKAPARHALGAAGRQEADEREALGSGVAGNAERRQRAARRRGSAARGGPPPAPRDQQGARVRDAGVPASLT